MAGDAFEMEPYRVEWRAGLTTRWTLLGSAESWDDARDLAHAQHAQHKGQVRVICQHVIMAKGLGVDNLEPRA